MKKILIITAILMMVASSAFAATHVTAASAELRATSPANLLIAKASKNVRFGVNYDAANGVGYALDTYHNNGTKMYGTAYDSTKLYFLEVGDNYQEFAAPTSSVTVEAFTGSWIEM